MLGLLTKLKLEMENCFIAVKKTKIRVGNYFMSVQNNKIRILKFLKLSGIDLIFQIQPIYQENKKPFKKLAPLRA